MEQTPDLPNDIVKVKVKVCYKCKKQKDYTSFYKNKTTKDGLSCYCVSCIKEYEKKNREVLLIARKKYRENNKDELKARQKECYLRDRERILKRQKDYKIRNKDEIRKQRQEYGKRLKESIKETPNFKICSRCKNKKSSSEFYKNIYERDGLKRVCKSCGKDWIARNITKVQGQQKAYKIKNLVRINAQVRKHRRENLDAKLKKERAYTEKNRERIRLRDKAYRDKNREELLKKSREYHKKNKDRERECHKKNRLKNWSKILEKQRERRKILHERLRSNISVLVNTTLRKRGLTKGGRSFFTLIGYTPKDLITHIESKFKRGMCWENYGRYWHLDHIIPDSYFKYEKIDDPLFKNCWALSNLQPLEGTINMAKGNRYIG